MFKKFVNYVRRHGLKKALIKTVKYIFNRVFMQELEQRLLILQQTYQANEQRHYTDLKTSHDILIEILDCELQTNLKTKFNSHNQPLVSVIMPVWNRSEFISKAINSILNQTYPRWQLIIVDDGSQDNLEHSLVSFLKDTRISFYQLPHIGVAAARNFALAQAKGEIIAYLDTDNYWYSRYLEKITMHYISNPAIQSVYTAQLVTNSDNGQKYFRCPTFNYSALKFKNIADLNVFSHRVNLYHKYGGFDENLKRLTDWDLLLRYSTNDPPLRLPILGGCYRFCAVNQITKTENYFYHYFYIQKKYQQPIKTTLKVLYVVWHYPQLSESYIQTEIDYMLRHGVQVAVWSEMEETAAPYPANVRVYHGKLARAVAEFKPNLLHAHWLGAGLNYAQQLNSLAVPMTVRGHGFEVNEGDIAQLQQLKVIKSIYCFQHFAVQFSQYKKVMSVSSAFNSDRYYPSQDKIRNMVLRVGAGLPTKDLQTYIDVAKCCREFKFVLCLARANKWEAYVDEIIAYNKQQGSPVTIHVNLQYQEVADLMNRAAIYFHTHGLKQPYGQPISIAEAMATGCYIIYPQCYAAIAYVGSAGVAYNRAEQAAAHILATQNWTDKQWWQAWMNAINHAYQYHADEIALSPILEDWLQITRLASVPAVAL